jgi:hypothetical protein
MRWLYAGEAHASAGAADSSLRKDNAGLVEAEVGDKHQAAWAGEAGSWADADHTGKRHVADP